MKEQAFASAERLAAPVAFGDAALQLGARHGGGAGLGQGDPIPDRVAPAMAPTVAAVPHHAGRRGLQGRHARIRRTRCSAGESAPGAQEAGQRTSAG